MVFEEGEAFFQTDPNGRTDKVEFQSYLTNFTKFSPREVAPRAGLTQMIGLPYHTQILIL